MREIPTYYKSESFVLCPSDVLDCFNYADVDKVKLIDDINNVMYEIHKINFPEGKTQYIIIAYDYDTYVTIDSDIFSYNILDNLLLQWLNDDNYIIFDI